MSTTTEIYLTYQAKLKVSLESDEKNILFERSDETTNKVVRTDLKAESSGRLVLPATTADYPLPMGKVATGKILYIETDAEISIKLDGGSTATKIKPVSATYKAKLLLESEFTVAPTLSCTPAANVNFCIVGLET